MRRQAGRLWIWVVLGAFLSFSICLPFGHVCLDQFSGGEHQAAGVAGKETTWQPETSGESHKDDVCQACLLGQNLLLDDGAVQLAVNRAVIFRLDRVYALLIAVPDTFQSASKRAPPAFR